MKLFNVIPVLLIVGSLFSCNKENKSVYTEYKHRLGYPVMNTVSLPIASIPFGEVKDFAVMPDSSFLITDGKSIMHFSKEGLMDSHVCKQGRGSNEYISAGKLFASDRYIYVWCDQSLTLLQYDYTMQKVHSKIKDVESGISSFIVVGDSVAYFYLNGESDNIVASVHFDFPKKISYYGKKRKEDKCLQLWSHVAPLGWFEGRISYSAPSEMTVRRIDEDCSVEFVDEEFGVGKIDSELYEKRDTKLFFDFLLRNSVSTIIGENCAGSYLLTETGEYIYEKDSLNYRNRCLNVFKLCTDGTAQAYQYPMPVGSHSYKIVNGLLYSLITTKEDSLHIVMASL